MYLLRAHTHNALYTHIFYDKLCFFIYLNYTKEYSFHFRLNQKRNQ